MGNALDVLGNSGLTSEDVKFIMARTSYDVSTIKDWYKDFILECPSGRLSRDRFAQGYKVFFPQSEDEEFCDVVFRTFDENGDGEIDFKEFMLAIDVMVDGSAESKLKWAFKIYDIDMNGSIEMHEMTKIVPAIYDMLGVDKGEAKDHVGDIFRRVDFNKDGVITMEEFMVSCLGDNQLYQMLALGGAVNCPQRIPSNFLV